ncbi:hypothetical protein QM467_01620 [Rhodoblastus sp. 17X3]|uniref:hypothetical protein n=1 Tax=Rhodoblastus sp. 17X3 TaxID=3047026 RepID=UPI0024B78FD7|nr:hypothetical protein [Rhodoblastus sp. 17X3]MDI9846752.1 hypothetical protein [Rhodoblastus sp. 17X3]
MIAPETPSRPVPSWLRRSSCVSNSIMRLSPTPISQATPRSSPIRAKPVHLIRRVFLRQIPILSSVNRF